ncbi:MAG: hypothetical protein KKB50_06575 [Planctomycetes bacterium]|nr:hypothetical protein [Planctomycetota bacterium]
MRVEAESLGGLRLILHQLSLDSLKSALQFTHLPAELLDISLPFILTGLPAASVQAAAGASLAVEPRAAIWSAEHFAALHLLRAAPQSTRGAGTEIAERAAAKPLLRLAAVAPLVRLERAHSGREGELPAQAPRGRAAGPHALVSGIPRAARSAGEAFAAVQRCHGCPALSPVEVLAQATLVAWATIPRSALEFAPSATLAVCLPFGRG